MPSQKLALATAAALLGRAAQHCSIAFYSALPQLLGWDENKLL